MRDLTDREQLVARKAANLAVHIVEPTIHKILRSVVIIGLILIIGGVVGWKVVSDQADAIQRSRLDVARDTCQETNKRYKETISGLNKVSSSNASSGQTPKELKRQVEASKFLIKKILPVQDNCQEWAKKRITTK